MLWGEEGEQFLFYISDLMFEEVYGITRLELIKSDFTYKLNRLQGYSKDYHSTQPHCCPFLIS